MYRMMPSFLGYVIIIAIAMSGCRMLRNTPKYSFTDGYYKADIFSKKVGRVYVQNEDDSLFVYPLARSVQPYLIDTTLLKPHIFPQQGSSAGERSYRFRLNSFDIDFLTMPFKIRPATTPLPVQFNNNLNGAVYLGYRYDLYQIGYERTPLNTYKRYTTHYGVSYGIFNGLGGTVMNPWVTNNRITEEYDGLVWLKGAAGIVAINNFTFGLVLGWDHMVSPNRKYWIYEGKPWIGLAFGLNLN